MMVDEQNEQMRDLLFIVYQHGGDDVTWKLPVAVFPDTTVKFTRPDDHEVYWIGLFGLWPK